MSNKLYKYGKVPTATTLDGWEKLIKHEIKATKLPRSKTQTYRKYYNIRGILIKGIKDNFGSEVAEDLKASLDYSWKNSNKVLDPASVRRQKQDKADFDDEKHGFHSKRRFKKTKRVYKANDIISFEFDEQTKDLDGDDLRNLIVRNLKRSVSPDITALLNKGLGVKLKLFYRYEVSREGDDGENPFEAIHSSNHTVTNIDSLNFGEIFATDFDKILEAELKGRT